MSTVIFKTEEAIFQFDRKSVMECLKNRKTSYQINELDTLIDVLRNQPDQINLSSAEHQYFGFVAIGLISAGEGSGICNICGKKYLPKQMKAFDVGPDDSLKAATAKKGGLKRLFRKKPKPIGYSGGDGIKCPEGHTLIFMITWRT